MPAYCSEVDEDDLERVECARCEEVVALIESENGICNWCHEERHQRQERYC